MAISALLRRRRVKGQILEVLLGHMTFAGLANRRVRSALNAVYKFCREHYYVAAPMWDEVWREVFTFRGLTIFLQAEWLTPKLECRKNPVEKKNQS